MPATAQQWQQMRQRGRTDLLWLCKEVLGFKDVCEHVHGGVINNLQQFMGGTEEIKDKGNGTWELIKGSYKPAVAMWDLPLKAGFKVVDGKKYRVKEKPTNTLGYRRTLTLIPRGHLKTTVATIAHSIQWILNYPDVRILISTASGKLAGQIMAGMKPHFQTNETFRWLYPEFCPAFKPKNGKVEEFGNQEAFTVVNKKDITKKESTVSIVTVGATIAGGHYDVIKHDDIVDKENVRTAEGIETVKNHFAQMGPLLETTETDPHTGWTDIVGTRYSFSDLYQTIIDGEELLSPEEKVWSILVQSAAPNYPEGPVLWPERVPLKRLREIEADPTQGSEVLYPQYLMNPRPGKSGLIDSKDDIVWVKPEIIDQLYARFSLHTTVDLAGMNPNAKGKDNDYVVVNSHGFGTDGNIYVHTLLHVRAITSDELTEYLFALQQLHPRQQDIKVAKDLMSSVLLPPIAKQRAKRNIWLPLVGMPNASKISKVQKNKGLQPFFVGKTFRFAADMHVRAARLLHKCLDHSGSVHNCEQQMCKEALGGKTFVENEIVFFPKYAHDDFLDTMSDAIRNTDGNVMSDLITGQKASIAPPSRHPYEEESIDAQDLSWELVSEARHESAVSGVDPITGW